MQNTQFAIQQAMKTVYRVHKQNRHDVSLQQESVTRDSIGGFDGSSWSEYATTSAIINPTSAARSYENEQHENTITHHVRIPYNATTAPGHRVVLTDKSNRVLTVQNVINTNEQDTYLHLECQEVD